MISMLLMTVGMALASPVGKIASYPCNSPSLAKFGSAVFVDLAGKSFALTSDHVLYHGDVCHRVYEGGTAKEAKLKAVNLGLGLGLLEVEGQFHESIAWEKLVGTPLPQEDFAVLCGVPYNSEAVHCDTHAQVLSHQSDRTILPLVKTVLEVSGHNEYGMSGGGIFDARGNFLALLSHQYLQKVVGGPAKLLDTQEGMVSGDLVGLGIPKTVVASWLTGLSDLRWDFASQLKGKHAITLDGVRFTPRECPNRRTWGDPVGIGGGVTVEGKVCEVVLTLEKIGGASQPWPFGPRSWFERTKERLAAGGSAVITGLYYKGIRYPLYSTINLLSKIEANVTPTLKLSDPFTEGDVVVKELVTIGVRTQARVLAFKAKLGPVGVLAEFLSQMLTTAELCAGKQLELVDRPELARLLNDSRWSELMIEDLDAAIEIKSDLYRAQELLKKIQG